ncbi:MAG: PEP-CTERM sorting domain-containing protein [Gemmataceae bacterium]
MTRRLLWLLAIPLGVIVGGAGHAQADPMVTLSSPNNLSSLSVGDQVEIDVNLQGLPVNDFIFVLDTKVLFPSSNFLPVPDLSNSSGLTPGPILSGPNQAANFNAASSLNTNNAIGDFSDSSPNISVAISQNGLYYSFKLQAVSPGSGTIQFDSTADANRYAANDTGFNFAPLPTGGPLAFTINPAAAGVPEPASMALATIGVLGLLGYRLRKHATKVA